MFNAASMNVHNVVWQDPIGEGEGEGGDDDRNDAWSQCAGGIAADG
jgi:hypothetical protein